MPDIVTGKVFVDGEKGITATKLNQIQSLAVIQPSFVTSKPASSTLDPTDQMLEVKGAGTYATITGSQLISSVSSQINVLPQIYGVRLRSFNACGNSTMETDQRNCGGAVASANGLVIDRWAINKTGSMVVSGQQQAAGFPNSVVVPGTSFAITNNFLRVTVTTVEATLGANDVLVIAQAIEGPQFRELSLDVHSVSLLVRTSLSTLKFGLAIRDNAGTKSLTKLCSIASPNTWQLVSLPNLPVWPTAGSFGLISGVLGYNLYITLSAGTSQTNSANDVWTNSSTVGAVGQDNFAANAGATFDLAYISHEPGAVCTNPPIDRPFGVNYDGPMGCTRYFQKSYDYASGLGSVTANGEVRFTSPAGFYPNNMYVPFKKTMAKVPTIIGYSPISGATGWIRDEQAGSDRVISAVQAVGQTGFGGFSLSSVNAAAWYGSFHYIADTGW